MQKTRNPGVGDAGAHENAFRELAQEQSKESQNTHALQQRRPAWIARRRDIGQAITAVVADIVFSYGEKTQ
jgi:hypothetical protein